MATKKPVVKKTAPKAKAKAAPVKKAVVKTKTAKPVKKAAAKAVPVKKEVKAVAPKKKVAPKLTPVKAKTKQVTKAKKAETVKKTVKTEKAKPVKEVKKTPVAPAKAEKPKAVPAAKTKKTAVKETPKVVEKTKKAAPAAVAPVAKPPVVKPSVVKTPVAKTPEPVKPEVKVEKPKPTKLRYTREELNEFKTLILEKQSEAINNLQTIRDQMLDPSTGEYINENSPYSLHMAEQGTDAMEKEKNYFYAQREQKFLGYLEEALKRIEAGTYGLCKDCIDDPKMLCPTCPLIPKERLEAVPHSQQCVQLKKMQEKPRLR